jgi:two-component system, OmpR family, sensor kinase
VVVNERSAVGVAGVGRRRRSSPSVRMRILGWYVALLGIALIAALLVQRAFLLSQVSGDVDQALDQEVGELRQLAGGLDPETSEPFGGDVAAIFDTFLSRNVPLQGEAIVTLVEGRPYKTDIAGSSLAQSELAATWAEAGAPVRQEVMTEDGPLRYVAVPLVFDGAPRGTFVVAVFLRERLDDVNDAVRLAALVYGSVFLVASALAWVAAGGILRPLRTLTDTARSITDTDWTARIPVSGDDEIAELGRTFNSMLDRLEAAFTTQRRFVDDAGHELRTPITIIRGNLEVMGDDPEERRQTMELVTDELDRMARIVDDLLVLATAERPDFLDVHPVDVAELTRDLAAKGAMLREEPWAVDDVGEAVIEADRQRVTQAMMNLMRNAVEHSPDGTNVAIGSAIEAGEVRLWVRDEGPGIDPAEQEHLFERFSRGRAGRRATSGAGLGLAIVRTIADAHRGRIEIRSAPGMGSTFTLVLPVERNRPAP